MKSYCIFILVLIIGILQSCDQVEPLSTDVTFDSENIIKEDGTIIKKMPLTEVPDIIENLTAISGKSIGSTSKIKYNHVRINLDSIVEVINLDKGSNYTLEMRVKGAPSNHIYNLVIHRSVSGILEAPYVIGYEIDPKFMRAFMESDGDLSQFVGEYHFYTYDQFFKDSKAGIVGESSDCGGGYTGGTSGPPIAPGSTFTQGYDGRTVEAIFSNSTMGGTYNFSSTIHTENGAQTHVATASSSDFTVTNPSFTTPAQVVALSPTVVSVNISTNTNAGSGAPCSSSSQIKDSGIVEFAPCPDSGSPTKKSVVYGKSNDCPSPEGGLALRGYDRAIQKVFYFLDSSLSWGELNFLEDNNGFPEILVSFFIKYGINEQSKGFVDEAIDATMAGSSVDMENRIINTLTGKAKCVYDNLMRRTLTNLGIMQNTYIAFNKELNYKEHFLEYELGVLEPASRTGVTKRVNSIYYKITINSKQIDNRAPIEIARTIIHESIHALLLKHYDTGFSSFKDIFKEYIKETTNFSDLNHSIMRDRYIIPKARALEQFDGKSESDFSYYENLAWGGLQENLRDPKVVDINKATIKAREKGLECN